MVLLSWVPQQTLAVLFRPRKDDRNCQTTILVTKSTLRYNYQHLVSIKTSEALLHNLYVEFPNGILGMHCIWLLHTIETGNHCVLVIVNLLIKSCEAVSLLEVDDILNDWIEI